MDRYWINSDEPPTQIEKIFPSARQQYATGKGYRSFGVSKAHDSYVRACANTMVVVWSQEAPTQIKTGFQKNIRCGFLCRSMPGHYYAEGKVGVVRLNIAIAYLTDGDARLV